MKKRRLLLAAALGMYVYKMMEYRNKPSFDAWKAPEPRDGTSECPLEAKIEVLPVTPAHRSVYFAVGGSVYHRDRNCMYLKKSSTVSEGTAEQACAAGKTRACSRCGE